MNQKVREKLTCLFLGTFCALLASILLWQGYFYFWQLRLGDYFYPLPEPNKNIVIIAIDDKSLQKIGRWPWERKIHTRLLNILAQQKPAVIGLDIAFPEAMTDQKQDQEFAMAIKKTKVVLPIEDVKFKLSPKQKFPQAQWILKPIPILAEAASSLGHVNLPADPDNIARRLPLVIQDKDRFYEAFSLSILREYLFLPKIFSPQIQNAHYLFGRIKIPTDNYSRMWVNFSGRKGTFKTYSYIDVLNKQVDLDIFKNKIVLIGATASDLHDEQLTPVSAGQPLPGVEIHANAISTILNGKFLVAEKKTTAVLIIILTGILASLLFSWLKGGKSLILTIFSIIFYYFMTAFYFEKGLILDTIFTPLTIALTYITITLYQYVSVEKEKRQIKMAFSQYVEPAIINEILEDPSKLKLGGEKKELTIFFSDLKNFTTISEMLKPDVLVALLNEYFTEMANIILKNQGIVDKYIGDSIMAIWGAPLDLKNHALYACKAALEMKNRLVELKKEWVNKGWPEIEMRIGINTGEAVIGNMGSDKRFDYTVMGDAVNLASRLEGINKEYGTNIIISEFTYNKIKDEFICRKLDVVKVKGKKESVAIYELIDFKDKENLTKK